MSWSDFMDEQKNAADGLTPTDVTQGNLIAYQRSIEAERQAVALERIAAALEVVACSAMWRDHKDGGWPDFEITAKDALKTAIGMFKEARNGE